MNNEPTPEQVAAVLGMMKAVADAIRDLGQTPSGDLYAVVMGHMSLATYEQIIDRLVKAKLVRRDPSHLLTWIGPVR